MKLIGAGLPRTGTLSQKVALEMLGLEPCYHMVNVLGNLDLAADWRRALDGDADWDSIFGGAQATVDWPGSFFYRELMEAYPDAKVLLSVREGDAWAKSMRQTIWGLFYDEVLMQYMSTARTLIDPQWDSYISMMKEMWEKSGLLNDGENTTAEWMAGAMDRYNEEVKQTVPADRLLVWTASDGWEPICEFLGVAVPDTPFPRLNDGKMFAGRIIDGALLALNAWREKDREAEAEAVSASPQ
jgi:Sulfotransferase domain